MKKHRFFLLKCLFLAVPGFFLCLAFYRLGQKLLQPQVLLDMANGLFVLALAGWTATAFVGLRHGGTSRVVDSRSRRVRRGHSWASPF